MPRRAGQGRRGRHLDRVLHDPRNRHALRLHRPPDALLLQGKARATGRLFGTTISPAGTRKDGHCWSSAIARVLAGGSVLRVNEWGVAAATGAGPALMLSFRGGWVGWVARLKRKCPREFGRKFRPVRARVPEPDQKKYTPCVLAAVVVENCRAFVAEIVIRGPRQANVGWRRNSPELPSSPKCRVGAGAGVGARVVAPARPLDLFIGED